MTPAATELLLVRHGQAHCNVRGLIGGPRGCTGLTEHGRQQISAVAHRLAHRHAEQPIHAAYTSPLRRARESADLLTETLPVPITTLAGLREPDYGSADGKPWSEAVTASGQIPALHPHQPLATSAEPWSHYLHRASAALATILETHHGHTVLVIGHGETITAAAHLLLSLSAHARASVTFAADYASLTHWQQQPLSWTWPHAGQRWALIAHNDTAHLHNPTSEDDPAAGHRAGTPWTSAACLTAEPRSTNPPHHDEGSEKPHEPRTEIDQVPQCSPRAYRPR